METRQEVTNPPFQIESDDSGQSPQSQAEQQLGEKDLGNVETSNSPSENSQLASLVAKQLASQLGSDTFDLWFSADKAIQCDCSKLTLTFVAEHDFALNRLQTTFGQMIRQIVATVCGPQFKVQYEIGDTAENTVSVSATTETTIITKNVSGAPDTQTKDKPSNRSASRTLRSFWFGPENQLLDAAVNHIQRELGQFSPLMIHGPAGCGKTHLLEAIVGDTRRRGRNKRCVYLTSEQFTSYFIQSLRGSGLPMFRRKYRDLDVLAIDDVQFFAKKKATLAEFQFTIDNLARSGKQIILASDCPPFELEDFQSELTARMSSGLVCQLKYPNEEGRIAVARRMCAERNLTLPGSVIELVANRLTKDVRRISGAINRLHALKVATNQKITDEVAEEVLSDLFAIASSNSSMVKIEKAICDLCGVKSSELKSSSRKKRISTARMLAMYLSRKYTSSAFSEIGDHFGGRSHSTVIAAEKKVDKLIQDDKRIELPNAEYSVREVISRIESKLRVG